MFLHSSLRLLYLIQCFASVLKKRETRLKREQDGLKSLVSGLVGGPALLKEWEREWRDRFGGQEKDEVEDDLAAAGSDDEDCDGEDSDGEDEDGRARKRAKVAPKSATVKKERPPRPPPAPISTIPGQVPEKRKRGRPRKNPLPIPAAPVPAPPAPATATAAAMMGAVPPHASYAGPEHPIQHMPMQQDVPMHHQQVVQQVVAEQPVQQYLLAIFAFFSVLNSPLASSYSRPTSQPHPQHTHHGHVLSETPIGPYAIPVMPPSAPSHTILGYHAPDLVQAFHLFVSTMVLFYIVMPWLSDVIKRRQSSSILSHIASFFTRPHAHIPSTPTPETRALSQSVKQTPASVATPSIVPVVSTPESQNLVEALAPAKRGAEDEAVVLRRCLGVSTGVLGMVQGLIKAARHDRGIELDQLEQRAWVRLGELVAFDGKFSISFCFQLGY